MIEFLNTKSAFEHYKRVLGRNSPKPAKPEPNRIR